MTENLLSRELAGFLRSALADFRLEAADGGEGNAVSVYEGYLPAKHGSGGENYPFAVVRLVSGSLGREGASAKCDVIFGAWSREDQGYQYALNMLRRAMMALLSLPYGILAKRYRLVPEDLEWEMDEDQPYPAWQAVLHTEWSFRGFTPPDPDGFGAEIGGESRIGPAE